MIFNVCPHIINFYIHFLSRKIQLSDCKFFSHYIYYLTRPFFRKRKNKKKKFLIQNYRHGKILVLKKKFSSFFRYRVCTSIWYFLFSSLSLSPNSHVHIYIHITFLSSLLPMYKFVEEIENHGKYVNEFFLYKFKEDWGWKYSFVCIYMWKKCVFLYIFLIYGILLYIHILYVIKFEK